MKTILVPIDFSDCAGEVVRAAASLAKAFGSEIILLHVAAPEPEFIGYEPGPQTVRDSVAKELHEEHEKLRAIEDELKKQGLVVTALLIQGYPVDKILEEMSKNAADIIVMGSHGHGALHNLLVGSVTEGVMRKATCPIHVVPAKSDSE